MLAGLKSKRSEIELFVQNIPASFGRHHQINAFFNDRFIFQAVQDLQQNAITVQAFFQE